MNHSSDFSGVTRRCHEFISRSMAQPQAEAFEAEFDALALDLFRLQSTHVPIYRQWIERQLRGKEISHWREIPALPISAFKEFEVTSIPEKERMAVFHSSSTTGARVSRHFHDQTSLKLYEASLIPWFERHVGSGWINKVPILSLTPSAKEAPRSSLVYMLDAVLNRFGGPVMFAGKTNADGSWSVSSEAAREFLDKVARGQDPVCILGTAFSWVAWLDQMGSGAWKLPPRSCGMETGGYKGRTRELSKTDLYGMINLKTGIVLDNIVSEYGMSELGSQAYDRAIGDNRSLRGFRFPPWTRVRVMDPETGMECAHGKVGLIELVDLANVRSVIAVRTEDLGRSGPKGLEYCGRAESSPGKGCSLLSSDSPGGLHS